MSFATISYPAVEEAEYRRFLRFFESGEFGNQRLGQAFYNHFNLHKVRDQDSLGNLYELDDDAAKAKIRELFDLH